MLLDTSVNLGFGLRGSHPEPKPWTVHTKLRIPNFRDGRLLAGLSSLGYPGFLHKKGGPSLVASRINEAWAIKGLP